MFAAYFVYISVYILVSLWFIYEITTQAILQKNIVSHHKIIKIYSLIIYFTILVMITVIIFMIYSSIKTSKKTGKEGEKGIAGVPGNVGRYGECNETCGVSTCVNLITNHVNTIFKNRKGNDKSIKNIYFIIK